MQPAIRFVLMVAAVFLLAACAQTALIESPATTSKPQNKAKNVILFIGDGMGVSTVTAVRILDGQLKGMLGEENVLSFETFPYIALSKTYNTNNRFPILPERLQRL